jgi:hypothetical protein
VNFCARPETCGAARGAEALGPPHTHEERAPFLRHAGVARFLIKSIYLSAELSENAALEASNRVDMRPHADSGPMRLLISHRK